MAKNKKAQILAAVMCAATVAGVSPAISSAADIADIIRDENNTASVITKDGAITGVADNLTFTVGDNTFAMDQYSTNTGALDVRGDFHVNNGVSAFAVENNKLTASVGTTSLEMTPNGVVLNGNTTVNGNVTAGVITGEMIQNANGTFVANANGDVIANNLEAGTIGTSTLSVKDDDGNTNFQVLSNGDVTANNINAGVISGETIQNANGTFVANANGDVTASNIEAGTIGTNTLSVKDDDGNTNFQVLSNGDVTATSVNAGVISGETIQNANGTFVVNANGDVTASNIEAGTIGTNTLSVKDDDGNTNFQVLSNGDVTAHDITASSVNAGVITGETLQNVNGTFVADANGNITATTVSTTGLSVVDDEGNTNFQVLSDGTVIADKVDIGIVSGETIQNADGSFVADANGNVTATTVSTTGLSVKDDEGNTNFQVLSDGTVNATNVNAGTVTGEILQNADGSFVADANGNVTATTVSTTGLSVKDDEGNTNFQVLSDGTVNATNVNAGIVTGEILQNADGSFVVDANGNVDATTVRTTGLSVVDDEGNTNFQVLSDGTVTADDFVANGISLGGLADTIKNISPEGGLSNLGGIRRYDTNFVDPGKSSTNIEQSTTISKDGVNVKVENTQTTIGEAGVTTDGALKSDNEKGSSTIDGGTVEVTGGTNGGTTTIDGGSIVTDSITAGQINGVGIGKDENGNTIINGTNLGELATDTTVTEKVNAAVGDTTKLNDDIKGAKEYQDNQSLVGAINAESAMRQQLGNDVKALDGRVSNLEDRMGDVEDRIDKVGAMAAAIANLRTMGYDPEAPTEIAVGVGQYESETGLALGVFHYPNQDFMLSASISTSGDEVMGGIGATWKIGRKSATEKERTVEEKRVEKAEEMQDLAKKERVNAQRERHAKMLAERQQQEA